MTTEKIPLVSVIIPMYNSAKFISQTLESLLYQTMNDFEVVIVDDCSTDNSVEVVEQFAKRFGGGLNLHVIKLPKNTGTPGLPRNVGIQFARGKYIAFLDSDDLYTKTALEELSNLAEKYQAEVVHTDSWYILWGSKKKLPDDPAFTDLNELLNPESYTVRQPGKKVPTFEQPTFDTTDFAKRIRQWVDWNYNWANSLLFVKRDFLISNQIAYPNFAMAEDMFFTFSCLCSAEKFLRVPNITYIVRPHEGSISRENEKAFDPKAFFHKRVSSIREGFIAFGKFMDRLAFFSKNPVYHYAVLDFFFSHSVRYAKQLNQLYISNPPYLLNNLIKKEFHADDAALASYLFNTVNIQRLQIMQLQQELAKFQKQ